jgi:hypothetical protein
MRSSIFGLALTLLAAGAYAAEPQEPHGDPPAGAEAAHGQDAGHDDHAAETAHRGEGGHGHGEFDPIYDYKPSPKIDYPAALTGKTLSAVAFLPVVDAQPVTRGAGARSLRRVMFEAYLAPGGDATAHAWNLATASYTQPARAQWTLSGQTLCLDLAELGPERRCFEVHIWGPIIAGTGTAGGGMLKGDLRPGNEVRSR